MLALNDIINQMDIRNIHKEFYQTKNIITSQQVSLLYTCDKWTKNNQGNKGFIVASNNKKYPRITNQTSERFV